MILPDLQEPKGIRFLPAAKHESYVRVGLGRYSNISAVKQRIIRRFELHEKQYRNAEKQAQQLSFCLRQAQEYLDAAADRSLATKPVLLYYACVSLALAEILWKGTGEHSLEKLRAKHGHHGLNYVAEQLGVSEDVTAAQRLRATMRGGVGQRGGTFGVWHRFARNQQIIGIERRIFLSGSSVDAPSVLLMPADRQNPELPQEGISLFECACRMPTIIEYLAPLGMRTTLLRSTLNRQLTEIRPSVGQYLLRLDVHPSEPSLLAAFKDQVALDANLIDDVQANDLPQQLILTVRTESNWTHSSLSLPEGYSMSLTETWFSGTDEPLNEFGYFYAALYICGMFARYHPDVWMKHLAVNSGLASLIDAICIAAQDRMPLLLLDELDHAITVPRR